MRPLSRSPSTAHEISADHSGIVKPSTEACPDGMRIAE